MPIGLPYRPIDLLVARAAGLHALAVRRPRLHLVNVPATAGINDTASFIIGQAAASGTAVVRTDAPGRDAASIAQALEAGSCDLVVIIGGTGTGHGDAAVEALGTCGKLLAHGIALQPGRTAAIGRIARVPVIALPGALDQALGVWWTMALPVLDRLSGRQPRASVALPLARKIASGVGISEIVLLQTVDRRWLPLASGELSLASIARADAWLAVPASSEGYAAGTPVDGYMMFPD
jgi:molybdopterin biosynthesis enzyme